MINNIQAPLLVLRTLSGSEAKICTQGAQVMSWIHRGRERLFISPRTLFQPGTAIRGGIPVIFPQFGANGPGPRHGFARLLAWQPVQTPEASDRATLVLHESSDSLRWWPHRFRAELEVQLLEDGISISLGVINHDAASFEFTAALHSYLRVSDIGRAEVSGLEGQPYIDAVDGNELRYQPEATVRFTGEVDRIYTDSGSRELSLHDASDMLRIQSAGFTDTVLWNPGAELAATMGDLGPGNHAQFVCVEAASVATRVRVAPGAAWRGKQTLVCND